MRSLAAGIFISFLTAFSVAVAQSSSPSTPLSDAMRFMQFHETRSNAISQRNTAPIALEHFEIPVEVLEAQFDPRVDPKFSQSLIVVKNGRRYVRWLINPEDTTWHLEVEKFLQDKGLSAERKKHFIGYQTASRSYLVKDPVNGAEFSIKVSTNKSGGHWSDKKQTWEDASQVRLAYEYVNDILRKRGGLKHAILIDEPVAFGIKSIDHGMLIRTYESVADGKTKLIPGFSVLHEQTGLAIAQANGAGDPERFWNKHYNKPLARALAELYALTGLTYDSPHSQNFLVELDNHNRPTGRIALRDLGDAYLSTEIFEARGRADILPKWEQKNVLEGILHVAVGYLHGNVDPSWLSTAAPTNMGYLAWGSTFFTEFDKEFQRITGVRLQGEAPRLTGKYFLRNYSLSQGGASAYIDWLQKETKTSSVHGLSPISNRTCQAVFGKAM